MKDYRKATGFLVGARLPSAKKPVQWFRLPWVATEGPEEAVALLPPHIHVRVMFNEPPTPPTDALWLTSTGRWELQQRLTAKGEPACITVKGDRLPDMEYVWIGDEDELHSPLDKHRTIRTMPTERKESE